MADEAKHHSPNCPTLEALVVWCVTRCCCGGELGFFHWPRPVAGVSVFGASHWLAEHTSQMKCFTRIQKAVVDQTSSRPPNSDHDPFFWERVWLGKCFGTFSLCKHWAGGCWLSYKIHFSLHITIQLRTCLLLCRITEDDHFKKIVICWFAASS